MTASVAPPSLAERAVDRITRLLARSALSRRGFLTRTAVVGSALAVSPVRFVLRPTTAYATVCGSGSDCNNGWTAFCCTINDGANACPEGSYAAGWWKNDNSAFCRDAPRYIIDCNRIPTHTCTCTCADGPCDKRRVCCNVFRYGQCNTHVPEVTEVVCRVVTCTPPWEWDPACSATVRTEPQTSSHTATCLPGTNPSFVEMKYLDLGLVGSALGAQIVDEQDGPDAGRFARYEHGIIAWTEDTGAHAVTNAMARVFDDLDGLDGPLGYPTSDREPVGDDRGFEVRFQGGTIWQAEGAGTHGVFGPIHDRYRRDGGAAGWLGYPTSGIVAVPGPWERVVTDEGWAVVRQTERDEVRVLPADAELPEDGTWPETVTVERWAGEDRAETAADIAVRMWPEGAAVAFVAGQEDFPDALAGGVAAAQLGGPLLLTPRHRLHTATESALHRLGCRRVVVLGGAAAVSVPVEAALHRTGARVDRWEGTDRYESAARISAELFPDGAETAYVATGRGFADALAAVPAAHHATGPLLLTDRDGLPDGTAAELRRLRPRRVVVLGGSAAVAGPVIEAIRQHVPTVDRVAGADRYATAAALADAWSDGAETVVVATGEDYPDGLAGGAAAALLGAPVLLVGGGQVPEVTWAEYQRQRPRRVIVVGGTRAVPGTVARQFGAALAPPAEATTDA